MNSFWFWRREGCPWIKSCLLSMVIIFLHASTRLSTGKLLSFHFNAMINRGNADHSTFLLFPKKGLLPWPCQSWCSMLLVMMINPSKTHQSKPMRIWYLEAEEKGYSFAFRAPGWAGTEASWWKSSWEAVLENDAKLRKLRQEIDK